MRFPYVVAYSPQPWERRLNLSRLYAIASFTELQAYEEYQE